MINWLNGLHSIEELMKRLDKIQEVKEDMRRIAVVPAIRRTKKEIINLNERQDKIDDLTRELLNIRKVLEEKKVNAA